MQRIWLPITLLSLLIVCSAWGARQNPPPPPAQAKCPVCGMFVGNYSAWTGVIGYKDTTTVYFDGPKDLFRYYLNPGKYDPDRKWSDIVTLSVKEYYSVAFIDGREAFYVLGSDVLGPMGKELVPFEKKADANGFLQDHRGKKILRFGEITPELLKALE